MSSSSHGALPVLALAVVLSAVTAVVTTSLLMPASSPPPSEAAAALPAFPEVRSDDQGLAERQELRRQIQELRDRVQSLEDRPAPVVRTPAVDAVSKEDFEALLEQVRRSMPVRGGVAASPELKTQVTEALTAIRRDEAIEKVHGAHEKRAAQLEQRLAGLSERLGLDVNQVNQMRTILTTRDQRDRELIRMWESGVEEQVLGEAKQTNAAEFQTAVAGVLTPTQLEVFRQPANGPGKTP